MKVLSCITWALGSIVWYEPGVARNWYSAIRDTALQLDKSLAMPERLLLGHGKIGRPFKPLFPTSTPFTEMLLGSMLLIPGYNTNPECARQHKIETRLAKCGRAVRLWLDILQECGVDLLEYGRQEKQRLENQENGCEFTIFRDVWHGGSYLDILNGEFEVRLIGFEYGREPGHWKLWWSEPTDSLVGNFWKDMEPEPLCIPGSWYEDF